MKKNFNVNSSALNISYNNLLPLPQSIHQSKSRLNSYPNRKL